MSPNITPQNRGFRPKAFDRIPEGYDDYYMSILVFNRIEKLSAWRRMFGKVRTYEVFEDPLI